jgi:ATP-dependent Clp protease ATP-binding subunit ClpB
MKKCTQILTQNSKQSYVSGRTGVGKTAIAEGLAHCIVDGDVPDNLKDKIVFSLIGRPLRAKYKGDLKSDKAVVKEVTAAEGDIVLSLMKFIRTCRSRWWCHGCC